MYNANKLNEINNKFGLKIKEIFKSKTFQNHCKKYIEKTPEMERIAKAILPVAMCNSPKNRVYLSLPDQTFDAFQNYIPTERFYSYIDSITGGKHQFEGKVLDTLQNYTYIGARGEGSYCTLIPTGVWFEGKQCGQLKVVIDPDKVVNNRTALAHELFHSIDERHWNMNCMLHYSDHFLSEIGAMYMEDLAVKYFTEVSFKDNKELCEKLKTVNGDPHLFNNIYKARDAYLDYLIVTSVAGDKNSSQMAQEELVNNYIVLWNERVLGSKINQIFGFMTHQNHYDPMKEARYVIGASINEQLHNQDRPIAEKIDVITTLNNNLCHLANLNHTDETSTIDITTKHLGVDKIEALTEGLANKINTSVAQYDQKTDINETIDSRTR